MSLFEDFLHTYQNITAAAVHHTTNGEHNWKKLVKSNKVMLQKGTIREIMMQAKVQ